MQYVEDTYEFQTHNPSYDEVQEKMEELKSQGWSKLDFEKGYKHIGRDAFDSDYTQNAKIYGDRKAVKSDFTKAIKELKYSVKENEKFINDLEQKKKEIDKEITEYSKEISGYYKQLEKVEEQLCQHNLKDLIKKEQTKPNETR